MATKTVVVDDLTGKESLTAKSYTITLVPPAKGSKLERVEKTLDLSDESATALWRWLTELDARDLSTLMRKVPIRIAGSDANAVSETEVIRTWAKENRPDLNVKDRGALPANVIEAYKEAHKTEDKS